MILIEGVHADEVGPVSRRSLTSLDVMQVVLALVITVGLVTILLRSNDSGRPGGQAAPTPSVSVSGTEGTRTTAPTPGSTPTSPSGPATSPTAGTAAAGPPRSPGPSGSAIPEVPGAPLPTVSGGTGVAGPPAHLPRTGGGWPVPAVGGAALALALLTGAARDRRRFAHR